MEALLLRLDQRFPRSKRQSSAAHPSRLGRFVFLLGAERVVYQEIQFHPAYALEASGVFSNNKTFILPTDDLYLLAVLNSPLIWWFNWRELPHMKDEALSPVAFK